ncbi:MAG: DNA-binding protein [Acidobacteria bacterium]|nr:DNA-binding protein [Acidobacteriota bacterium]
MRVKEVEGGFILRLEKGEELIASLAELMKERDIGSGAVTGLGAVDRARLGCYLLEEQDYSAREFEGDLEIVGLTGTLSWYDGEPFPHVHLMLTDRDFGAAGGHCFEARVSATIELVVRTYEDRIERRRDESIGLHLMEL